MSRTTWPLKLKSLILSGIDCLSLFYFFFVDAPLLSNQRQRVAGQLLPAGMPGSFPFFLFCLAFWRKSRPWTGGEEQSSVAAAPRLVALARPRSWDFGPGKTSRPHYGSSGYGRTDGRKDMQQRRHPHIIISKHTTLFCLDWYTKLSYPGYHYSINKTTLDRTYRAQSSVLLPSYPKLSNYLTLPMAVYTSSSPFDRIHVYTINAKVIQSTVGSIFYSNIFKVDGI